MVFKLLLTAEKAWRRLHGNELVALVRAVVKFAAGVRVERKLDDHAARPTTARVKSTSKQDQDARVAA